MSFKTFKVKVEFDMVVAEENFDSAMRGVSYELAHKIRIALADSKDYMISLPKVETVSEPK
jgi:hypothetical protein